MGDLHISATCLAALRSKCHFIWNCGGVHLGQSWLTWHSLLNLSIWACSFQLSASSTLSTKRQGWTRLKSDTTYSEPGFYAFQNVLTCNCILTLSDLHYIERWMHPHAMQVCSTSSINVSGKILSPTACFQQSRTLAFCNQRPEQWGLVSVHTSVHMNTHQTWFVPKETSAWENPTCLMINLVVAGVWLTTPWRNVDFADNENNTLHGRKQRMFNILWASRNHTNNSMMSICLKPTPLVLTSFFPLRYQLSRALHMAPTWSIRCCVVTHNNDTDGSVKHYCLIYAWCCILCI